MSTEVPAGLVSGTANRGSTVHATDSDAGDLSRGHLEEDIARVQSATLSFSNLNVYKIGDMVVESDNVFRAILANGPGEFTSSDWVTVSDIQFKTDITLTLDQLINTTGDTDITGLTFTLINEPGKFGIITFNIFFVPGNNDRDVMFRVSDNATITNNFSRFGGETGGLQSVTITYIAALAGQVVKAICAIDGGLDPLGSLTIKGTTVPSSAQLLEID